jgi:competence protein ComEA
MNSFKRILSEWLGYSRRERRASMILVIIIATVILVRYVIPEKGVDIDVSAVLPPSQTTEHHSGGMVEGDTSILFNFDPNTAAFGELTSLGIASNVARTLIRYRSNGGIFHRPEDIRKIYGMDSALAERIIPYIKIELSEKRPEESLHERKASVENDGIRPSKIDINRSDSADLLILPGIGRVLSARIVKYRELLGGFVSVLQMKEVYGISDSVCSIISEMIIVDSSAVRRIKINSAGFSELDRHPYIERYDAQAILKYREIKGKIEGLDELKAQKILNNEKAGRLSPYLLFD